VRVTLASSFWQRLRGLLGRRALASNEGLLLAPCTNVHTFWMRFPIDAVFLDREGQVLAIAAQLKPWRAAAAWRAHSCLELAAGGADRIGLRVGQRIVQLAARSLQTR
jgi:uncharacterized membrane protein (UPF0127 family)